MDTAANHLNAIVLEVSPSGRQMFEGCGGAHVKA